MEGAAGREGIGEWRKEILPVPSVCVVSVHGRSVPETLRSPTTIFIRYLKMRVTIEKYRY